MGNLAPGGVGVSQNSKGEKPPATPSTAPISSKFTTGAGPQAAQAPAPTVHSPGMPATASSPFSVGGQMGSPAPNSPAGPGSTKGNPVSPGGWAPAGSSYTGPNGSVVIPGQTFIPTGMYPGQGYYVPTGSQQQVQNTADQSNRALQAQNSPFVIAGQKVQAPPVPTAPAYSPTNSGDTQGAASVPQVPNPYLPNQYSAESAYNNAPQDSKGVTPPYQPYSDTSAWGGGGQMFGSAQSPLLEALRRRNQDPEARYYG